MLLEIQEQTVVTLYFQLLLLKVAVMEAFGMAVMLMAADPAEVEAMLLLTEVDVENLEV